MAWRASTRPRIDGSDRIWTMAVDVVMNVVLARPSRTAEDEGQRQVRARR